VQNYRANFTLSIDDNLNVVCTSPLELTRLAERAPLNTDVEQLTRARAGDRAKVTLELLQWCQERDIDVKTPRKLSYGYVNLWVHLAGSRSRRIGDITVGSGLLMVYCRANQVAQLQCPDVNTHPVEDKAKLYLTESNIEIAKKLIVEGEKYLLL
jgi:hypothetical protein